MAGLASDATAGPAPEEPTVEPISRRQTLAGAGLIGVGLPVLAACGGDG